MGHRIISKKCLLDFLWMHYLEVGASKLVVLIWDGVFCSYCNYYAFCLFTFIINCLHLQDFVRQEALHMLQNALEGCGGSAASSAYTEAFRLIMRLAVGDKSFTVRIAAARCLKAFANIGGPGLGVAELDNSASYCVKVGVLGLISWWFLSEISLINIGVHIIRPLRILFHLFAMPLPKLWVQCLLLE